MKAEAVMGAKKGAYPLTENTFFNAARPRLLLYVESGTDEKFWQMHQQHLADVIDIQLKNPGQGGRSAILKMLDEAQRNRLSFILALLDADLDRITGRLQTREDVIWTDAHDLETTLLCLPVLEKLVRFHLSDDKRFALEQTWGESFRERLFRHAEGAGRLRWLSQREQLPLHFKKLKKNALTHVNHGDAVTADWSPSLPDFIDEVINFSQAQPLKSRDLVSECQALPAVDQHQLCNGHDLIGFLRAGIEVLCKVKRSAEDWTHDLFLAVEFPWLETTQMWQTLRLRCQDHLQRLKQASQAPPRG